MRVDNGEIKAEMVEEAKEERVKGGQLRNVTHELAGDVKTKQLWEYHGNCNELLIWPLSFLKNVSSD